MKFKELFNDDWSVNWAKIDGLPSFEVLKQTPQSYKWHKEGCVLNHVHLVAEEMEKILSKYPNIKKGDTIWLVLMSAAICHDLGKAETTFWSEEKNDWSCKNHGVVGERITRNLEGMLYGETTYGTSSYIGRRRKIPHKVEKIVSWTCMC